MYVYPHQWGCSSAQNRISTVDSGHDNCQQPYKKLVADWHIKKFDSDHSQGVSYESALTSQLAFLYLFSLFCSLTSRPCINIDWWDCDCNKPKPRGSKAFVQTWNRTEQATVCTGCLNRSPPRWYQRFTSRLEENVTSQWGQTDPQSHYREPSVTLWWDEREKLPGAHFHSFNYC